MPNFKQSFLVNPFGAEKYSDLIIGLWKSSQLDLIRKLTKIFGLSFCIYEIIWFIENASSDSKHTKILDEFDFTSLRMLVNENASISEHSAKVSFMFETLTYMWPRVEAKLFELIKEGMGEAEKEKFVLLVDLVCESRTHPISQDLIANTIYIAANDSNLALLPNVLKKATEQDAPSLILALAIYHNASGAHTSAFKYFEDYFNAIESSGELPPRWSFSKFIDSSIRCKKEKQASDICSNFKNFNSFELVEIKNQIQSNSGTEESLLFGAESDLLSPHQLVYFKFDERSRESYSNSAALTIVSRNYMALALTLADSFLDNHPDSTFFIVVVDESFDESCCHSDVIQKAGIVLIPYEHIDIPDSSLFKHRYSILELNTAVKPFALDQIFKEHEHIDQLLYIDPDIKVYAPLSDVWDSLASCSICLTPHLLSPLQDSKNPSEIGIMQSGTYNLGFIGLSRTTNTKSFLAWWKERLFYKCKVDIPNGLFTDQKWIDLVPGYFDDCRILRLASYNAAYWNLHERIASHAPEGFAKINGEPLRFFHFSGYSPLKPSTISKHQDRHSLSNRSDLQFLFNDYKTSLISNRHLEYTNIEYAFSRLPCGITASRTVRWVLEQASINSDCAQPDINSIDEIISLLTDINCRLTSGTLIAPILAAIIEIRPDVKEHFGFVDYESGDLFGLVNWTLNSGAIEEELESVVSEIHSRGLDICNRPTSSVSIVVQAWEQRNDLQIYIPDFWKDESKLLVLNGWLDGEGGRIELGLTTSKIESIIKAMRNGFEKTISAYIMRSDLQNTFPRIYEDESLNDFVRWAHQSIAQFPGLTHDELDAFAFICRQEKVMLLSLLLVNSQWLRNFIPQTGRLVSKAMLDLLGIRSDQYELAAKANLYIAHAAVHANLRVNLVGNFSALTGIGVSARTLQRSLSFIPSLDIRTWCLPSIFPFKAYYCESSLRENSLHEHPDISISVCNADSSYYLEQQMPASFWSPPKRIAYWVWETETLPAKFAESAKLFTEIWTPSAYSASAIKEATDLPVKVVPHSLPTYDYIQAFDRIVNEKIRNWGKNPRYRIGYFYDPKSYSERKNPAGFLQLVELLIQHGIDVDPILKVNGNFPGQYDYETMLERAKKIGCEIITESLSETNVYDLISSLDIYVSLHRAEGFGLTCAEAMSLGVLTVATGYSGNIDFMNDTNSVLVKTHPYTLRSDVGPYPFGTEWRSPDVNDAFSRIVDAIDNRQKTVETIQLGFNYTSSILSPATISDTIKELLS